MIQTVVSNASAPEYGQATISFPIREEDYGKASLRQIGADKAVLKAIDRFMDFAGYGEEAMERDGVMKTRFAAILRVSKPMEQQAQEQTMKFGGLAR